MDPSVLKGGGQGRRPSRVKQRGAMRLALIEAAANVVKTYGYAGCTIGRVTSMTGIAHGAFYNHFETQQDLFDTMLPVLGARMLDAIALAVHDAKDIMEIERLGLEANLRYLIEHPFMHRVVSESPLFAPNAYRQHMTATIDRYCRSLQRSVRTYHIDMYDVDELETVAIMLVGMRASLFEQCCFIDGEMKELSPQALKTYMKFVANGLLGIAIKNPQLISGQ